MIVNFLDESFQTALVLTTKTEVNPFSEHINSLMTTNILALDEWAGAGVGGHSVTYSTK